jgi:hypothetical protein
MIHNYRQRYTCAAVMVGNFNPVIVQPTWLAFKELIREQESKSANIEVIHNEVSKWKLDWLEFEATPTRMEMKTSQEPYLEPMKDLISSIWKILKETPISAFGINHLFYFALPDDDKLFEFGNKLVPLDPWSQFMNKPRVAEVVVMEQKRNDGFEGNFSVFVKRPDVAVNSKFSLLIQINDHFDFNNPPNGSQLVRNVLNEKWKSSYERAHQICEEIWNIK